MRVFGNLCYLIIVISDHRYPTQISSLVDTYHIALLMGSNDFFYYFRNNLHCLPFYGNGLKPFFPNHQIGTYYFVLLLLGSTFPMQEDLPPSPQHPRSPFPDALLSSTSCTSAPLSPPLLDLGVDIQAELEKDVSELDFTLLDSQGKKPPCVAL